MSNACLVRPLSAAISSASSVAAGYDAGNVLSDYLGVVWKSNSGAAAQSVAVDLGVAVTADALVLLGLSGALASWNVELRASTSGGSNFTTFWTSGIVPLLAGSAATTSGRGRAFLAFAGAPAARYWQVVIYPDANQAVTIGRVVLGNAFRPTRNFDFGAAFGVRDTGSADFSSRGVLMRRRGMKLRSVGLAFNSLYRDEVEGVVQPMLEKVGGTGPIALILDPDAHAQRQNRVWFGPLTGDIGTIWAKAGGGHQWQANLVDLESFAGDA